jgi:NodT family efflux transporter outer membrane factor (OMF) lipoprotein
VGRVTAQRPARGWLLDFLTRQYGERGLKLASDVNFGQMLELYGDSRLAPNESIMGELNFRLFEASSTGCLVLGQDLGPEQEALFEPGRDMEVFGHVAGLKSRLDFLLKNPRVAQAKARIRQARASLRQTRAGFFPSIDVTGSTSTSDSGLIDPANKSKSSTVSSSGSTTGTTDQGNAAGATGTTSSGMGTGTSSEGDSATGATSTTFTAGFDATWELDIFGGQRRSFEAAKAILEASVADLRGTRLTLLGDVATNYINLRAYQEQLAITVKSTETQRQNAEITRARYKMGLITQLEVAQSEGQAASTAADIPVLNSSIKECIHRLGILLGLAPGELMPLLAKSRPLPQLPATLLNTGLPSELLARRPDVRKAERELAAASANIGVATAALYPSFDLTAGLGLSGISPSQIAGFSTWYWSVVPKMTWNIFNAGKNLAAVDEKRALFDESLASYKSTFHTALEDVENALAGYFAYREREQRLAASVAAYEDARTLANERFTKGLTNFLTVLVNEASLYEAQTSLSKARASARTQLVALYKALGGGWKVEEHQAKTPDTRPDANQKAN